MQLKKTAYISVNKAIEIAAYIFSIKAKLPKFKIIIDVLLIKSDEQK